MPASLKKTLNGSVSIIRIRSIFVIMELILPFSIKKPARQIHIKDAIVLMGSCFAEEIGFKLKERRFNALINPHGILYNPLSLSEAMADYLSAKKYSEKNIFHYNEVWQSFKHHGRFSKTDAGTCIEQINLEINKASHQLKNCRWLIITFGSAFAYRHKKTSELAGNCHKIPSAEFEKILLSKEEIIREWKEQMAALKKFNSNLNVVFTVSPVRYVRDGLIENNRSKGILLDAVHSLVNENENCFYFPAYEIVIDELRDYRFYKEDLVHPNHLAVNYVWEKFVATFCDEKTQNFLEEYEPLLKGLQHRPLHEETEAHKKFKMNLAEKIKALDEKYL